LSLQPRKWQVVYFEFINLLHYLENIIFELLGESVSLIYTGAKKLINNKNVTVGRYSYGEPNIPNYIPGSKIIVGNFTSIGGDVSILLGGAHHIDYVTTFPFDILWLHKSQDKHFKTTTKIGNDVWIGHGATILGGVNIGDGAIIGAGTVVSKNVEPYSVIVGSPMKCLRKRFSDDIIEALLRIKWWNWSDEKISKELPLLLNADVKKFVEKHDQDPTEGFSFHINDPIANFVFRHK
jgi:acetyltransferase-like isoleucine patch superfamily enzyme